MGILDDIQQLQMQGVQQGAQQQGFTQPPESPDQPVSQIGAGGGAASPQQPAQPQSQAGRLQSSMADYAGMLLQQAQQLSQPETGFRKGFGSAMMHAAGLNTPREQQLQGMQAQLEALRGATGVQDSGIKQQQLDYSQQMVQMQRPDGTIVTLPQSLMGKLGPAFVRGDVSSANNQRTNATKQLLGGYRPDGSPMPLSELSIPNQLKTDLQKRQMELIKARVDTANADTSTPAGRVAAFKLKLAERNADSLATRASAAMKGANINGDRYLAQFFGTDAQGNALPGISTDSDGNPVGTVVSGNSANMQGKRSFDVALDADQRLKQMQQQAKDVNPASDKALLFNHIAMTLGAVKGGRVNEAEIQAHLKARDLPSNIMVAWDGVSKGLSLSPEQRQNFLKLGVEVRNSAWQKAITRSDLFAGGNSSMPTPDPDLPELDLSGKPEQRLKASGKPNSGVLTLTDGGKTYRIPAALKASFLKDHPNAR